MRILFNKLNMNSSDSVRQVKLWIFEHACKHGMETVLRLLVGDKSLFQVMNLDTINVDGSELPVDPIFMFLLLLKKLKSALKSGLLSQPISSVASLLSLAVELLNTTYTQIQYVSFTCYLHLITRLKLLDLLNLIISEVPNSVISEVLNMWFPRWSPTYRASVQSQFNVTDQKALEKLRTVCCDCRKFILHLTISKTCREKYLATNYETDMKKHISDAVVCLNRVISAIRKLLPLSIIEEIVQTIDESSVINSSDPSVQLIPEYVQSTTDESQILNLLHALDSSVELRLTDGLGTLSDYGSDLGTENDVGSEGEEVLIDGHFDNLEIPLPPLNNTDIIADSDDDSIEVSGQNSPTSGAHEL